MADTIDQLNENVPTDVDLLSVVPSEIRDIKKATKGTFPTLGTQGGVVSASAAEMNHLAGVTSNVQAQIDAKPRQPLWGTKVFPDGEATPVISFNLEIDKKTMFRFFEFPTNNEMQLVIPDKALAVDGSYNLSSHIYPVQDVTVKYQGFSNQVFRLWVNNPFDPAFETWVDATIVTFVFSFPQPIVLCTYSSALDKWVVRISNNAILSSWSGDPQ